MVTYIPIFRARARATARARARARAVVTHRHLFRVRVGFGAMATGPNSRLRSIASARFSTRVMSDGWCSGSDRARGSV